MKINSCLAIKIYFVGAMFELTIKILKLKDIKHKGQKEKVQKDKQRSTLHIKLKVD
jgi:hypothetical protein